MSLTRRAAGGPGLTGFMLAAFPALAQGELKI